MKDNIEKLLFESGTTMYAIHQATGIAQTTLSRFKRKESDIGNMSLDNAIKLNKYYEEMDKMANFKTVGRWWSSKDIKMVEIEEKIYALDGWNGESYLNAWECTGEGYTDASEQQYTITPVYADDEIIDYEVM